MSADDGNRRSPLPWVMAALVLVIGGAKLDFARPHLARALAVALPIVPVVMGVKRLEGGDWSLERAASVVGWLTILAAELCVAGGFFQVGALTAFVPAARLALGGALAAALVVHNLEARRGSKARFAGFIGSAGAFAAYLSWHQSTDAFASVLGSFFVALVVGGAALVAGELSVRLFKRA